MGERCPLSDLLVTECGCRVHAPAPAPTPTAPARSGLILRGPAIEARYPSRCKECNEPIHPGDLIRRTLSGPYVHEECTNA